MYWCLLVVKETQQRNDSLTETTSAQNCRQHCRRVIGVAAVRVLVALAGLVAFSVVVAFLIAAAIALGTAVGVSNSVAVVVIPTLAWLSVNSCEGLIVVCS